MHEGTQRYDGPDLDALVRCPREGAPPEGLGQEEAERVRRFHRTLPGYRATPLARLDGLAARLGIRRLFVKDESPRFGLNAFKVLGGAYAVARVLGARLGIPEEDLSFQALQDPDVRGRAGSLVFATATDGNHGRGVAWAARTLGYHAVVFLPRGVAPSRVQAIRDTGAEAILTDLLYDDVVRQCRKIAKDRGWVVVQDTSWEGYQEIPRWILQGYLTLGAETAEQLLLEGEEAPTHVFLQAGVGTMAAALAGYLAHRYRPLPRILVVEPDRADCFFVSAAAGDGMPHPSEGDLVSVMAGLCCGEPNPQAWPVLDDLACAFLRCRDHAAALGMRLLARPLPGDPEVRSGESGAVGPGLLYLLATREVYAPLREALDLGPHSVVLAFSTEGDTDPEHYRKVLWEGAHPVPEA